MKIIAVVASVLALSGCISTAPTQSQLDANARQCKTFGYAPGSKANSDCQFQLSQVSAQKNETARANAHATFSNMAAYGSYQQPAQFSPVYTGPQQVIIQNPQPTLSQTVNSTMRAQKY